MPTDDMYDVDLEATSTADEPQTTTKEQTEQKTVETKEDDTTVKMSKEDAEYLARARDKEARDAVVSDIKSSIPDFDENKVFDKILELEAKQQGAGAAYYNRVGMEALWLKHFARNDGNSDNKMDNSRSDGANFDFKEIGKKINSGEASITDMRDFYTQLGNLGKN
ncbi:hypothetical protein CIG2463D_1369 [Campylobacter iguaniorum]|uniref:hypothetical protein n=1 Tax=Campylobacter iguaniorum TaxID=1244531 RepID=UPI000739FB8C|nr:hypothetical protein [Campylobacter iguaniorum]ALV24937.1 hypothetical protein CIG2463D_1369 [Campylobacter iguaniorum]